MNLRLITLNEDKTSEEYTSAECQELLNMYIDFYPKIGFNIPWVGYFVVRQDQIVGSCGFVGQPKDGKVEIAYWTFKDFEGQGIASFACQRTCYYCSSDRSKFDNNCKDSTRKQCFNKNFSEQQFYICRNCARR